MFPMIKRFKGFLQERNKEKKVAKGYPSPCTFGSFIPVLIRISSPRKEGRKSIEMGDDVAWEEIGKVVLGPTTASSLSST